MNDGREISSDRTIRSDQPIRVFDSFCGIGGFRLGLQRVGGFAFVGSADIDAPARAAYNSHFAESSFHTDIRGVNPGNQQSFDLFCGGFPCQTFSTAGKREGFLEQTKGTLFFECARIGKDFRPICLFLENVKGFANHDGGRTLATALCTLEELGYAVEWQVVNSAFVNDQARERIYIVAHLADKPWRQVFPIAEKEFETFRLGLDKAAPEGLPQSGGLQAGDKVPRIRAVDLGNLGAFGSRHIFGVNEPTPTLVTSDGLGFVEDAEVRTSQFIPDLVYTTKIRRATELERERLMGFPDEWTSTPGNAARQRVKQTGNAVVVPVIQIIGQRIKDSILYSRSHDSPTITA